MQSNGDLNEQTHSQLIRMCGGIWDNPAVMQSNYTVIVMGFKLGFTLSKQWLQLSVGVAWF